MAFTLIVIQKPALALKNHAPLNNANTFTIQQSQLSLEFSDSVSKSQKSLIMNWIRNSAMVVKNYYGQFPVKKYRLQLITHNGSGVSTGTAYGGEEPLIEVHIGNDFTEQELKNDWILIHEMIHLAMPELPRRHHWFLEGQAVYIESIARIQAGQLTEDVVWKSFIKSMPQGLPKKGDKGLDYTPTWGRKYWGGALYCLLADIEIRKRTNNRLGLQHVMRAILNEEYSINRHADIVEILKAGDEAIGLDVLNSMYQKMRATPAQTDLAALWQSLGVSIINGKVSYNKDAPLSNIRAGIFKRISSTYEPSAHSR